MRATSTAAPLSLALLLAACGSGAATPMDGGATDGAGADAAPLPPGFCEGPTRLVYDPLSRVISALPDDVFTEDDATSPTGLRVRTRPDVDIDLPKSFAAFAPVFADLSLLDGFGTTSALYVRFSGPVDAATLPKSGDGSGQKGASIVLVDLDAAPPSLVDIEVQSVAEFAKQGDLASTLLVSPMLPLRPKGHYALAVTTRLRAEGGGCIAPSAAMAGLLTGTATDPKLTRVAPRYAAAIAALKATAVITAPTDLVGALVFTTQHTVDDSAAVARDIRSRKFALTGATPCVGRSSPAWRCFEAALAVSDYRVDGHHLDEAKLTPQRPYTMKVAVWLPADTNGAPYPTMIYGHGLGGDRWQADKLADIACPKGFAVVALDAAKHGEHPDQPKVVIGQKRLDTILGFFGFSLKSLDARVLRDNWRQSTYDKLQLIEALRAGADIDGSGGVDVSADKLVYLGVSLGGIMSAELLAFAPDIQVAVPIVPGARVTDIVREGADLSAVVAAFRGSASDGDVARFFPVLQAAIDRGDAGAYTRHVVKQRLPGFDARAPQVLMQMVIGDTIVPNSTNRFFARGLGVPHLGDQLQPIGSIPHVPALPVTGNIDASHTAGVFQYDVVWNEDTPCCDLMSGTTEMATHGNVAANPVAIEQSFEFLDSWRRTGVSRILDPYRTLKIKP